MKVALACSGIGRVRRGFERYVGDLHAVLRDTVDVTLFRGAGAASAGERSVFNLPRDGRLARALGRWRKSAYFWESASFAAALWPRLLAGRFDLVHAIDIPTAQALEALRRRSGARWRLLYTAGSSLEPWFYPRCDHVHHVSPALRDEAIAHGHPAGRSTLLPCGLHARAFLPPAPRAELRRRHGVPDGVFVVLCVAAVNRAQKRIDRLVEECAALPEGEALLWLDGRPEEPELLQIARARLGARVRCSHVPSASLPELYGLADLLVLPSLEESFGLAIVEAMAAGLPVLVHDAPHFRWVAGEAGLYVDMAAQGALASRLAALAGDRAALGGRGPALAASAAERFDWQALRAPYRSLWETAAAAPADGCAVPAPERLGDGPEGKRAARAAERPS